MHTKNDGQIDMDVKTLENYLYEQIPASKLLEVKVKHCSDTNIELAAPLYPNINHKNTAFGGSLSILAILAGWSLVYLRLQGTRNEIVIQESSMSYLKPATADFSAICTYDAPERWNKFNRSFTKRGKGRVQINSTVLCQSDVVAAFVGTFVALNKDFT